MRACLSPQAHPSNKAPEIIEFLKKNTLVLKGVVFFSDTFCRRLSFHKLSQTFRKPPNSEPPPFFCSKKVAVAFEDPRYRWRQPWRQRWTLDLWSSYGSCSSGQRFGAFFCGENGWLALVVSVTKGGNKKITKKNTHRFIFKVKLCFFTPFFTWGEKKTVTDFLRLLIRCITSSITSRGSPCMC